MTSASERWICCQIGAREHYAAPRSLHNRGALEFLFTETWVPPGHPLGIASRRLRERFHPGLLSAKVFASNLGSVGFELRARLAGVGGWERTIARNDWFQRMACARLAAVSRSAGKRTVFAYSYAARDILKFARSRNWRTVLGQIDAGPPEERIVARLYAEQAEQVGQWLPAPSGYWHAWQEECAVADRILVNSAWSKAALEEEGVPSEKIRIIPLAYERSARVANFDRAYPERFSHDRPLRVLFLGQINLRKGALELLEAAKLMHEEPIEFWLVGPRQITIPSGVERCATIRWFGPVSRGETERFYREADVFIFPTFSDGFGLTQLEAQAHQLPIVASRFCGEVVEDGRNGILLPALTPGAIAEALQRCLADPKRLSQFAAHASQLGQFGIARFGERIARIFD